MAVFSASPSSPARVHERACKLIGHRAAWLRTPYSGGRYSTEHFRVCSYCTSIHPLDLAELLRDGSNLESTTKEGKFVLFTPNPVGGDLVRVGSVSGRVFDTVGWPQILADRLYGATKSSLQFEPTIGERLSGHFERPALEVAPAEIVWPFYSEHASNAQWQEILAAANHGVGNEIQGT